MDLDANDLLGTNEYIPVPNLDTNTNEMSNNEFKTYYETELKKREFEKINNNLNKIELKNVRYDETTDDAFANNLTQNVANVTPFNRYKREISTLVSIDSRDRIKNVNPNANDFNIFLNKSFKNVKQIELVSIEFPNTDAVINSFNNKIYWRNQQDIDSDITQTINGIVQYPVYTAELKIGSYTITSLQTEISKQMNLIRRQQGTQNGNPTNNYSDYHFFVVTLNINTDIVSFTSLILSNLPNNALSTTVGSGIISVNAPLHGYSNNSYIYIRGATQAAGLSGTVLNGFQLITVINSNTFQFTVNVNASATVNGGGNTIQTGKQAPFQLLWGEKDLTVSQNIGYALENSSQTINTNIVSLQNIYQMVITTVQPLNFETSYDYIGNTTSVGYILNDNFISYQTFVITDIKNTNSILVQVNDNTVYETLNNNITQTNTLKFGNTTFDIESFTRYNIVSFLITTQTEHNYNLSDVGKDITLVNTYDTTIPNDPNYDGTYTIYQVPSSTTIILPGVIGDLNLHSSGLYGYIARKNSLTTWTVNISNIIIDYVIIGLDHYAKIITDVPHKLQIGDTVYFNNVISSPIISTAQITSIPDSFSFLIKYQFSNIDYININNNTAFIGTGLITVSFPSHNFNNIVNISNGISVPVTTSFVTLGNGDKVYPSSTTTGTTTSGTTQALNIQTVNPHNLSIGSIVRITFSNTLPIPDITGGGYIIYDILSPDTFSIINLTDAFDPFTFIPSTITGILGMNNSFYLYNTETIGGINSDFLNSLLFNVRDIIDINTFTFMCGGYANSIENGGGLPIYISSLLHGFNGAQTNQKNNMLNRSINLEGENYCFLTCPQLNTMLNTGTVTNVFARISLDQGPGYVCFKFLSNPKIFYTVPLDILSELQFSIYNYNNTLYEFNDLDYSFCLRITEIIDYTDVFNISSRRGITDIHN